MVRPALALSAWLALAMPTNAQTADCPVTEDRTSCTRMLACIGNEGVWFDGRSFGRGYGTLAGHTSDGALCTGRWTSSTVLGFGQAEVACDDGFAVTVLFYYQEPYTGTALGRGLGSDGRMVRSWSGLHVLDYLGDDESGTGASLPCGEAPIPIS